MVRHKPSGDVYVGKTASFGRREKQHYSGLAYGSSSHVKLRERFTPFLKPDFEFVVLERCAHDRLGKRERHWQRKLKPKLNGEKWINEPPRRVISFKIDDAAKAALERHRTTLDVEGVSIPGAARDLLIKTLRERGLL